MSETYTVQAGDDSWMNQAAATTNYYTTTYTAVGSDGTNRFIAIYKFDLSPIIGTEIVSATFTTYMSQEYAGTNRTGYLFRLLVEWTPNLVTYNKRTASNWTSPGARGSGTDTDRTAFSSRTLNQSVAPGTAWDWTLDTTVVQGWADGDYENHGWVLDPNYSSYNDYWRLCSFEHGTTSYHPKLVVVYNIVGSQLQTVIMS